MCTRNPWLATAFIFVLATTGTIARAQEPAHYGFGAPVSPGEVAKFVTVQPDGRGLPIGSGDAAKGVAIYREQCAACHGAKLEGNPTTGIGGDRLIGGRGTLASKAPVKTVESYWPYATTLFDYIKRAMPFNAPGSLSDSDVYAVVAYVLSEAKIIKPTDVMDSTTLPKVVMPNRDGFEPDPRPEAQLYR